LTDCVPLLFTDVIIGQGTIEFLIDNVLLGLESAAVASSFVFEK